MSYRTIQTASLVFVFFLNLGLHATLGQENAPRRPNLLLVFADDQRPDTIAALGNPHIDTPTLDRLVRAGVSFSNNHCFGSIHGAVCQPSRAMLHSGRSLYRIKMDMSNAPLLGEQLGQHGYQTFGTGKWHNGKSSFGRSFQKGKTIMFGGMSDHTQVPIVDLISPAAPTDSQAELSYSKPRTGEAFSSELFVDSAIDFLKTDRDPNQPFFCYVALTAPHDPRQPPESFREKYYQRLPPLPANFLPRHPFNNGALVLRDEVLAGWPRQPEVIQQQLAEYYGLIEHADQQVGRLLDCLEEEDLVDNTIVVYTADHGLAMGSHGLLGKQSVYEHSMGSPMIIRGPGIPRNQKRDQLVYLYDLMPTFCQWAGVPVPAEVEGQPLQPILADAETPGRDYLFTCYTRWQRAIRDQRWKLIHYPPIDRFQLFDLQEDPNEIHDLADDPELAEVKQRLSDQLKVSQKAFDDPNVSDPPKRGNPEVNLSEVNRKPDQWQPDWIIKKYFPPQDSREPETSNQN